MHPDLDSYAVIIIGSPVFVWFGCIRIIVLRFSRVTLEVRIMGDPKSNVLCTWVTLFTTGST